MNPELLYRQNRRSIFWIAFISALAIHVVAIALATTKSPTAKIEDFKPSGDVELIDVAEPQPALQECVTPPPLEQIHPDEHNFPEENSKPSPVRAYRNARPASLVRGTTASLRSMKAMVAYAPRPVYPYEARRQRVTESGLALLTLDQTSGTVTNVLMMQSCGNAILDNSTRDALRMAFQARECGQGRSADYVLAYGCFVLASTVDGYVILCACRKDVRSDAKRQTSQATGVEGNFNRFEIPLLQYARRITGDREQARDVVQETFVKFQRNGALRHEDEPATWLFTVSRMRRSTFAEKRGA
jgi:Sigma-70 region 2